MVSLLDLNAVSDEEFVVLLGGIYEHSDWVPTAVLEERPFNDPEALVQAMKNAVNGASDATQLALIDAHPDLAGKLAKAGALTEASTREQAGLGLDRLSDPEHEVFSRQNESYRAKFGFPFIICARLTTKQGVLDAFETRLANHRSQEISTALQEIHEIARLRLEDLIRR